jgi:tripartite-type tricarboxylate transporter receptor subunit TctC
MTTKNFDTVGRLAITMLALFAATPSSAQAPASDKAPIRLIVSVPAGGSIDLIARLMADKMKDSLNEPVVVENRGGAGGRLAMAEVKKSPPDGRTIYIGTSGPFTVLPNIYGDKLEYDANKDYTPIGRLVRFDLAFAVGPAIPAKNIKDAIAWARANPDKAAFGTPGPGTTSHFVGVMIAKATGINLIHVPYKGGTPAINDVIGGHLPFIVNSFADMFEQHKAGGLTILADAGPKRSPLDPTIPTLRESGIDVAADVAIDAYFPANTSAELVKRTNAAMREAINAPDVTQKMRVYGLFPAPTGPEELVKLQAEETKMWAQPIKDSGFTGE